MPLYEQIADDLVQAIRSGHYCPGDKLPSIRQLAQERQVSVSTVQKAFELLEDRHLVEPRPKSGYYLKVPVDSARGAGSFSQSPVTLQPTAVNIHAKASQIFQRCEQNDLINLGTSYPAADYYPLKQLKQLSAKVVREQMAEVCEVHFSAGNELLRSQLARRMGQSLCHVGADELIITNGCLEALSICLRAVAQPGDTIAVESPGFVGLLQLIESMGYKALEIPCDIQDGMSLPALELALDQWDIKAVALVPTFSNPSGSLMPQANRKRLVDMLAERDIPLIEDDLFVDLAFDGALNRPCKAYDRKGLVLYCNSASKAVASGLRVGWIAPGAYYERVEYYKTFTNISAPNFAQLVMAQFLQSGKYDRHLRQLRTALAKQMYRMRAWGMEYFPEQVSFNQPLGGCILWVNLGPGINAWEFYEQAADKGIGVLPGPLFTASKKFDNHIRLNCACDPGKDIEGAMRTLGEIARGKSCHS